MDMDLRQGRPDGLRSWISAGGFRQEQKSVCWRFSPDQKTGLKLAETESLLSRFNLR
jgi:hypothetical protein